MHPGEFDLSVAPPESLDGKALRKFWRDQFQVGDLRLADTYPHRLWCAWRMVRELARLKGLVQTDEWLEDALGLSVLEPGTNNVLGTFWNCPTPPAPGARIRNYDLRMLAGSVPLTPPRPDERPCFDRLAFCEVMRHVAAGLRLDTGSQNHPTYGRIGMEMLYSPESIVEHFPPPAAIVELEAFVADQVSRKLQKSTQGKTKEWMWEEFGLLRHEQQPVLRLAMRVLALDFSAEMDERRAMMVGRLEHLAERAREGLDLKTELGALKVSAMIQGLTANKPEDEVADFVRVVAGAAQAEQQRQITTNEDEAP